MNNCIIYSKKFDSLTDGFNELTKYVPSVKDYIDIEKIENVTEETLIDVLIAKLKENISVTDNPNFPYTYSFKCDMYGVTFDTDKRFSFGWKPRHDENGNVFYIMRVLFPLRKVQSTSEHNLLNDGWKDRIHKNEITKSKFNNNKEKADGGEENNE
jgi:hypothetical protein